MRDKFKQVSFLAVFSLFVLLSMIFFGKNKLTVLASENSFVIDADMLATYGETYDVQITIENFGEDWEGTVRMIVDESYNYRLPSAYDTTISLPQGSKKQFVVKVPKDSMDDTDGTVRISLLDKKSQSIAGKRFDRLMLADEDVLPMGILSNDYSTLTYLDMEGQELYFYDDDYPVKLVELNQDNLIEELNSLTFLVIDNYNTDVLTEEQLEAIELWNYDGGVLIVGTGSYAEDTLEGLHDSYLEIDYGIVAAPGEIIQYDMSYVNYTQVHIAQLQDTADKYNEQYINGGLTWSVGEGAAGVLPYSLTEIANEGDSFYQDMEKEDFVMNLLDEVSGEANTRYYSSNSYSSSSQADSIKRMLGIMGNCNSFLQFGILKFIIIVYVIFVGPILYLILRGLKKRELYWITVPITAFLGIVLVFFAGRGFEVVSTRVFSVTTENLSNGGDQKTFMYCYDANHSEWDLKLRSGYEYVGALMNDNYNYDDEDEGAYYHHVQKEGDELSFGIKPSVSFEDSYFYAGNAGDDNYANGKIVSDDLGYDWGGVAGTISNETTKDFIYYAVIIEDDLYVYKNLPAGETRSLGEEIPVYKGSQFQNYYYGNDYIYDFLQDAYNDGKKEEATVIAALGVGLQDAYQQMDSGEIVVIGITDDWEKAVDDNCKEISYGCLYTIK